MECGQDSSLMGSHERLRDWKRHQSTVILSHAMAMCSLEFQRYFGRNLDFVFTSENIRLVLVTWEDDFRLCLSEHMHSKDGLIVHPHPVVAFRTTQMSVTISDLIQRRKLFNPWFHGVEYALPTFAAMLNAAKQIFMDDNHRRNSGGTTVLQGASGSGKTRLT